MKKLLLFTVIVLVATAFAVYGLILLDNIVIGTLYNNGVQFNADWAIPYWTMLRAVLALEGLVAVFTVVSAVYVFRKYIYSKPLPKVKLTRVEKKAVPSPASSTREPESLSETQRVGGLVKCTHCNKVFAQPLRMLDFHSDRPRIVNICPFCNEVIPPILRREEVEKGRRFVLRGKKNEQGQRKGEVGEAEESREAVAA